MYGDMTWFQKLNLVSRNLILLLLAVAILLEKEEGQVRKSPPADIVCRSYRGCSACPRAMRRSCLRSYGGFAVSAQGVVIVPVVAIVGLVVMMLASRNAFSLACCRCAQPACVQ